MDKDGVVKLGIVGVGGWGKNLLRNFCGLSDCEVAACCDINQKVLAGIKKSNAEIKVVNDYNHLLEDSSIKGVVIATPVPLHYKFAKKALEAKKHVFVEKPLTLKSEEAADLIKTAEARKRKLMVGHLLRYHPAAEYLKKMVGDGQIGNPYYIYTQRVNLGIVRKDENAWWSLAPHDVSIILDLFNDIPEYVSAKGECYLQKEVEDVVFVNLHFKHKRMAQIHVSWLDPHKMRKMTVVGSRKMVIFDDMEVSEKVKVYDKGVDVNSNYTSYVEFLTLRDGDIHIPKINMIEPLKIECQHFIDCIKKDKHPRTDGKEGLRVVQILEAAHESLQNNGLPIKLKSLQ